MATNKGSGKNKSAGKSVSGAKPQAKANPVTSYLNNHKKVAKATLEQHKARPIASFFTCSVVGIALVLPALLAILLGNLQSAKLNWDGNAQITLFLKQGIPELDAGVLAQNIEARGNVLDASFVHNASALEELKTLFKMEDALAHLDENPLPHTIVVTPDPLLKDLTQIERLSQQLEALAEVDHALLDALWVQRLHSITQFLERGVWLIAIMLAIAVLLIVGNTIRLAIENRREEIIVLKLVGGTDQFVCRPFLYSGMFLGLGGSLIAIILIQITIFLLNGPIETLAQSYQSQFTLSGLNFESTLFLLVFGIGLGWLGSWLAVHKHLDEIEPT